MFVTIQIPIADVRPFAGTSTARLGIPGWPTPQVGREFVRAVGPVRERRLGGVSPWLGEGYFADASRAIRFPPGFGRWPFAGRGGAPLHCLFRKFFSDGAAVQRAEIAFGPRRKWAVLEPLSERELFGLIARCLEIPVDIPTEGERLVSRRLVEAGPALERHLLRATTSCKAGAKSERWWLRARQPTVALTYRPAELPQLPLGARRIEVDGAGGAVHYLRVQSRGGIEVPVWMLALDGPAEIDRVRRIRLHLFRLHAEREVLKWVLSTASQGLLADETSGAAWDRLQKYLSDTLSLLERGAMYGIGPSPDLQSAVGLDGLVSAADRESLLIQVSGMRGNVLRKLERAVAPSSQPAVQIDQLVTTQVPGGIRIVEDKSVNFGNIKNSKLEGVFGSENTVLDSFQKIEGSAASDAVKDGLKAVVEAVDAMRASLDEDREESIARDLEGLVGEATASKPRASMVQTFGRNLLATAKAVGEVGLPVVKTVAALLALFP